MSDLPTPITRSEQYLEKIATGLGELPAFPITRSEIYLDYIATHGSGIGLPDPEAADIGKVLGIVEDGAGAKYAPVAGSGLPDPTGLSDGTAAIVVNGEWKMQEGYGYTGDPAFENITWDGDTTGRDAMTIDGTPFAYKVSDTLLTGDVLIGASSITSTGITDGIEVDDSVTSFLFANSISDGRFSLICGEAGEYQEMGGTVVIPSDGTYFSHTDVGYIKSLTAPSTVHQFDPELIGNVEEWTFTLDDDTTVTKKIFVIEE